MKKIKSQTLSSESNSNQQSPTFKENSEENDSNCLESTSMIEEINSPSIKSFCEETETLNAHHMLEGVLIPQRSISTPLIVNTFNLRHSKADAGDNHKRVQHALEVLQKKMLMEQQASLLKDILFKAHAAQEPLIIPPLMSASDSASSPANFGKIKKIPGFEDDQEVIYGPVEYPLLAMAPPLFGGDSVNGKTSTKGTGLFGSLAATRAETQRSESDDVSSCSSEESAEALEVKRRKSKKTNNGKKVEVAGKGKKVEKKEKKEKVQGKEKTRTRKQK